MKCLELHYLSPSLSLRNLDTVMSSINWSRKLISDQYLTEFSLIKPEDTTKTRK